MSAPSTQLPFLVWFIVSSLLLTLKRESGDVLRAAGRVLKSVVSLAVEEGVACAFGRVLCPLKTALTENMDVAAAGQGPTPTACLNRHACSMSYGTIPYVTL